jgi:CRISPR-associated endonuclease/helicase Cas3
LLTEAGIAVAEDTSGVPPDEDFAEEAWSSGIVVTSAVAFMEALTHSSERGRERWRLLQNAVIILDDCCQWISPVLSAFAILRLQELRDAGGRIIFSSATLPKYWQMTEISKLLTKVPTVETFELTEAVATDLSKRVKFSRLERSLNFRGVAEFARENLKLGSGLIVVNTIATALRLYAVLHVDLSNDFMVVPITSRLCRRDKRNTEQRVREWLASGAKRILVIATSCIEAGWDVSFAWAMREDAWVSNLLQVAGRVNRHGEHRPGSPVWSFQISDPLSQSNPELRDQTMCFQALHKTFDKIGPDTMTEATQKLMTEFSPRLLGDARRLVAAWRLGDRESVERCSRLIRKNRSTCFVPISRLPEDLQKRISDKSGLLIDSRTFDALYPYQVDIDSRLFKETPWKFEIRILNGKPYYFLSPEEYDPNRGGVMSRS